MAQEEPKTKRTRIVIRRSRNGCITCKQRKVRCDETTPFCTRCEKYGIQCDGYSRPHQPQKPLSNEPKLLLPKTHSSKSATLNSELFRQLFRNEQEYRYFNIFCTQTAHQISGHFSSKLWQTLILQTSQAEALIRHAVIALGALINAPTSSSDALSRRQFAYHQYQLSISLLRTQTNTDSIPPNQLRTTLLACLLFSIFETYNGYIASAAAQIYAGVSLLSDWQHSQTYLKSKISSIKSPHPLIIEDELIRAFSELEIEAMCRHDSRSSELHEEYRYYGQMSIDTMPASFEDTTEARAYLILIGQRALHFTAWMKQKSNGALGLRSPEVFERLKETEDAAKRMEMEYDKWEAAFEGIWIGGSGGGKKAMVLRIQLLTARAWKEAMGIGEGKFYGENTSMLSEIVELTRKVRDNSDGKPDSCFGFEGGMITALRTVGFVYRHRRLKREAAQILLERPWKEGLWDSFIVGKALEWLIDFEDEGVEEYEEHVPEENVLKDFKMAQDEMRRRTIVTGLQAIQGPYGEVLIKRELIIPWLP